MTELSMISPGDALFTGSDGGSPKLPSSMHARLPMDRKQKADSQFLSHRLQIKLPQQQALAIRLQHTKITTPIK